MSHNRSGTTRQVWSTIPYSDSRQYCHLNLLRVVITRLSNGTRLSCPSGRRDRCPIIVPVLKEKYYRYHVATAGNTVMTIYCCHYKAFQWDKIVLSLRTKGQMSHNCSWTTKQLWFIPCTMTTLGHLKLL